MDSVPPVHGPTRPLDDIFADLDAGAPDDPDGPDEDEEAPADLPEVVEAVTGRARDLHRLADRLSVEDGDETLSAVALLRAHAGAVGDLAEHLQAAGGEHGTPADPADSGSADGAPATTGADAIRPDDADPAPEGAGGSRDGSRGGPRHVG
jgi:hypothetical protein